jgi:hypothetical protein
MVVVPLTKSVSNAGESRACGAKSMNWVRIAAAGALAASGVLMVSGKRRAGLVTALSGAALAALDQRETVSQWWKALPACVDEIQGMLNHAQIALDDISVQGAKLRSVLGKRRPACVAE